MTSVWFDWLSWGACMLVYAGAQLVLLVFGMQIIQILASLIGRWRRRKTSGE